LPDACLRRKPSIRRSLRADSFRGKR
jgi:hypothetical protein